MRFVKPALVGAVAGAFLGSAVTGNKGLNGAVAAGALSGFGLVPLAAGYIGAQFLSPMISGVMGGSSGSANGAF